MKISLDQVWYWLRLSPVPPWQLDDLQPTEPMKRTLAVRSIFTSAAKVVRSDTNSKATVHHEIFWRTPEC